MDKEVLEIIYDLLILSRNPRSWMTGEDRNHLTWISHMLIRSYLNHNMNCEEEEK